ncbi:hypothetical protein AT05_06605 [Schleiferia thermophila str. Yellowstone]|jgi:hypothetical protein|nr:hypothetical protein AT05_06605 [Schleiferia thermophila str. Yellowstone]PMB30691.1 hypothetical protein CEN47_12135 [Fischerella thermalis CCMEE 5319]
MEQRQKRAGKITSTNKLQCIWKESIFSGLPGIPRNPDHQHKRCVSLREADGGRPIRGGPRQNILAGTELRNTPTSAGMRWIVHSKARRGHALIQKNK